MNENDVYVNFNGEVLRILNGGGKSVDELKRIASQNDMPSILNAVLDHQDGSTFYFVEKLASKGC